MGEDNRRDRCRREVMPGAILVLVGLASSRVGADAGHTCHPDVRSLVPHSACVQGRDVASAAS